MSKSTLSFNETKLVDYCDREGIISTSKKGKDGKWKVKYPNEEVLSSNFDFFLDEELKKGSIKFFILDESDVKWIHETLKLSGEDEELMTRKEELKAVLKSLADFVKYRENKRIYIREVPVTSEKPSERRRVFTEEVLEIIPIILKQQNHEVEEWNDLLENYQLEWKREHVHNSINMETFNSVLEEFNINKGLITIFPDPILVMTESIVFEFGQKFVMRLSPDGKQLFDSAQAIFSIFQRVVWGINWKSGEKCRKHDNCKREMRRMIIEMMRQYQNVPEGGLIPVTFINKTVKWLENQCFWTLEGNGICLDMDTSITIDTTSYSKSLNYHVYQQVMYFYALPNYHSSVDFSKENSRDLVLISVWMTRVLLLVGWTQQFFDKESVDLANVVLTLILKKVPVAARNNSISFFKSVQASIAGITYIPPPGSKIGLNSNGRQEKPTHQKMLKKAQERKEKLRERKEQSKSAKARNPSSTNALRPIMETSEEPRSPDEFVGASSFLDNQEYPESKLTFTFKSEKRFEVARGPKTVRPYHKKRKFGNVPNIFSLLDNTETKDVLDTRHFDTYLIKELNGKIVIELEKKDELVEEENAITMAEDEDRCTIDEFQKEKEDVTATEEKGELQMEDVKTLEKEVERPKENAERADELEKEFTELVLNEDAQRANESENQLKKMIVEQELLKKKLDNAKNVIEKKESEIKIFKEKNTNIIANLENQIMSYKEVVKTMSDTAKDMEKEKTDLSLKLMTVEEERDSDIKEMMEEKQELRALLEEKTRKVDDFEKKMKLRDSEMNQMRSELKELKGLKKQSEDQEKWRKKKNTVIERLKSEAEKFKSEVSKKEKGIVRLKNELSKSAETNESLVMQLSRLEEETRKSKIEEQKKNESFQNELFKKNEELQTANRRLSISEKEEDIVRLTNELSKSAEANESLVMQFSRLEEEMRKMKSEKKENESVKNELLKKNEELQTANRRLSIVNEEQERRVQNLFDRLAKEPQKSTDPPAETLASRDSLQSEISMVRSFLDKLESKKFDDGLGEATQTIQRLRNIKDRFQNEEQLKLARTMTDKLITMSNRSEIRELAQYEYQQYEANFQNYTQLVDLNIQKMKETRDCSLYSPLPKPPAFSDRFMNEYWLECDNRKKHDSECLYCLCEMKSDEKTLKCDHCKKITHHKCASEWLQIHRSCPHCRKEQLDPKEFPALRYKMVGKRNLPVISRNFDLSPGVLRFSASRLRLKKGEKKPKFTVTKNAKLPRLQRDGTKFALGHAKTVPLRKTLTPGTVLIVLAGRHKGKRVVFLKQLPQSGLLLVTGPHKINGFPLRRIGQSFVIATSLKVNVSGVKIPDHINDEYFKRKSTSQKTGKNIFASGKAEYTVSEQRKKDIKTVDAPILAAIKKHPEHKFLFGYLGTRFSLGKNQYPHKMQF
ncbi:hypothetical protein B9Z55_010348 [Caenorhabditis nigoni]|uniref:60S ribosomal protein L6 n=1 Tax=Caenorhabditis nigoni TaxID=1611254 RepID=A0A2G5UFG4_9PELO|nr:hypothetical protein B9Z55_010348 [Caenorhabditis nigoni]